jgi:hypothetical protein
MFREKVIPMFLIIGIVLVVLWLGGFFAFHAAGFLIHLLLIFAVISIIFHFLRGRTSTV